jgi:hypothetical protein
MADYRAAWVPEHVGMDWDEAARIAVDWVEHESNQQGTRALLVTVTKTGLGDDSLAAFANRHEWTTPQSSYRTKVARRRPVLVYVPDERTLAVAAEYARGSSLCAIEGFATPLSGWARSAGAVDLLAGLALEALQPELIEALERLHFYGNNGWTRGFGQDRALHILEGLRNVNLLDKTAITGDMLARGHGAKPIKRLGELIDKVADGRRTGRS